MPGGCCCCAQRARVRSNFRNLPPQVTWRGTFAHGPSAWGVKPLHRARPAAWIRPRAVGPSPAKWARARAAARRLATHRGCLRQRVAAHVAYPVPAPPTSARRPTYEWQGSCCALLPRSVSGCAHGVWGPHGAHGRFGLCTSVVLLRLRGVAGGGGRRVFGLGEAPRRSAHSGAAARGPAHGVARRRIADVCMLLLLLGAVRWGAWHTHADGRGGKK